MKSETKKINMKKNKEYEMRWLCLVTIELKEEKKCKLLSTKIMYVKWTTCNCWCCRCGKPQIQFLCCKSKKKINSMNFFSVFFGDKFKGFAQILIMILSRSPHIYMYVCIHIFFVSFVKKKLFSLTIGKTFLFVRKIKKMNVENMIRAWIRRSIFSYTLFPPPESHCCWIVRKCDFE